MKESLQGGIQKLEEEVLRCKILTWIKGQSDKNLTTEKAEKHSVFQQWSEKHRGNFY